MRTKTHPLLVAMAVAALAGCQAEEEGDFEMAEPDAPAGEEMDVADEAEPTGAAILRVETYEGGGSYLTDGEGRALYLFTADSVGVSTCYGECADAWPPFVASSGQPRLEGTAASGEMASTLARQDGTLQVTYGGHPLYYYAEDAGPGDTMGQDVHGSGGEWYLVTPEGNALESEGESAGESEGEPAGESGQAPAGGAGGGN